VTAFDRLSSLHPDCPDLAKLAPTPGEALLRAEAAAVETENAAERDRFLTLARQEEDQQDGKGVTRRTVLAGTALTATALVTSQWISTRVSFGANPNGTLVHVFLYGGLDGLSLAAPANDPVLQRMRPEFLLPANGSLPLGRGFVLNRAFQPLKKYLDQGELTFVPGVSDPRLSRSHFQAQDACQLGGLPNETGGAGWLDTLIGLLGPGSAFRSVGMDSTLPRSQVGRNGALALRDIGDLKINGDDQRRAATEKAIATMFTGINHPVESSVKSALQALTLARTVANTKYTPANGVDYGGGVGNSFRELARLIKGGGGVRAATIAMGGYDTHEGQGTNNGQLFGRLEDLATAMSAFFDDLGEMRKDVTVLVTTEFGRRVAQNGGGTDHGHGGVSVVLSGRKVAGPLLGRWDGLGNLDNGDVPEFNNMFDLFGSVAMQQFALTAAQVQTIFPRRKFAPLKVLQ
jgi:uncharacterized protein (DUF1501 family)